MTVRLALTLGEPAGIGPDIALSLAAQPLGAEVVVVGSPDLLIERASLLQVPIELKEFDPASPPVVSGNGRLSIIPVPLRASCIAGTLNGANSHYVLDTLVKASDLCISKTCDALVTGPVHKAIIRESGVSFMGHTEFFAELAKVNDVLMTFYTPSLLMALVTTHCPLKEVVSKLSAQRIQTVIGLLHQGLLHVFKRSSANITVCGLNPHAGESGLLGDEEDLIIRPAIQNCQAQGIAVKGPVSADTAFTAFHRANTDAIIAMYHDQGLAPFKALFFKDIVNVTLGLPYIRTSVDHGTALDLAGTGKADPTSLSKAIQLAIQLSSH